MGPAPWLCPSPVPVPHGSLMESSYGMLSPACVGSRGQTGVPAAQLRALSPALGNRGPSARFTAAIKSELALALLLHGHSLGINRSLPAPGSGSTSSYTGTPPRGPLSPRASGTCPAPQLFGKPAARLGVTQLIPPCLTWG